MKTHKHLYARICEFDNIHHAYLKARRGKRYKDDVLAFSARLEEHLIDIHNQLTWQTYQPGAYHYFTVTEPKTRMIAALPFTDRVVHHCLCNVIEPIFEASFIRDSYACRPGGGVLAGVLRTTRFLRDAWRRWGTVYCLKGDVSKYFYSVDHETLKRIIRRKIACPDTLGLIDRIIDSPGGPVGMPIGNLTSQLFANVYLDALDHHIKGTLRVRYYVRYMDDFVIFHHDKAYLRGLLDEISGYLHRTLHLTLNGKTQIFPVKQRPVDFLGYRIWPTHRLMRKANVKRTRRKFRKFSRLYHAGRMTMDEIRPSIMSWLGHAKHGDTWRIRQKVLGSCVFSRDFRKGGIDH
ncbi:MAG: reverse transcriptase/maturase family protein [Syntrophales bacterium]|jgi:retron-type reverse transcriptase|nr:reverse transcriptase/maturase family protein [Dehalococcoidia bacterium]MDD4339253.1 reverse transcriptase/maturase family protein [Syntrophales bacterium]